MRTRALGTWCLVASPFGHWDGRCFRELPVNYLPSTSTMYYYIDYELIFPFILEFNYTYGPYSGVIDKYYECM